MMVKAGAGDDPIHRAKAGDRFAFDELVGPLVDQAFRLAFGMLHDREAAEDAVQEATVRSWRKLDNLKAGTQMRSRPATAVKAKPFLRAASAF